MSSKLEQALAKHRAGEIQAATELYQSVLADEPTQPDALHMLGLIAQQKQNPELALKLIEAALAKKPDMALAWCNRTTVLRVLGRREEALQSAQQAIEADPKLADGWDMAGSLLREMRRYEEAVAHHKRAVELQPKNIRFQSNYAVLLLETGDLVGAYKAVKETEKLDDKFVPVTLGNVLKGAGYPERAVPCFRKTSELMPQYHEAKINEALAWLQIGAFEEGWDLWEQRPETTDRFKTLPLWKGERVKHLLLYEEQGMGDAIQFIRYLPMLKERAERITLQLTGYLQKLMAENFTDLTVLSLDEPVAKADARIQLMSLPHLFKTRLDNIPCSIPYMRAPEKWRAPWRKHLAAIPKPWIGLVWGGNPNNRNDHVRSIPFAELDPLITAGGAHFISLQKGVQKAQVNFAVTGIFDADPFLTDFTATAGLIAELDLLITVDTAVVHLAGAMGKPAWLLIPFDPDWRWLLGREDSPWYPSLKMYRQSQPRDWAGVAARTATDVKRFLQGDKAVLKPASWRGAALKQNPQALILPN